MTQENKTNNAEVICTHSFVCEVTELSLENGHKYRAVLHKDNLKTVLDSPIFDATDKGYRRDCLDMFFWNLEYVLRRSCFPEHTQICDETKTDKGTSYSNLRYPDEDINNNTKGEKE